MGWLRTQGLTLDTPSFPTFVYELALIRVPACPETLPSQDKCEKPFKFMSQEDLTQQPSLRAALQWERSKLCWIEG